MDHPTIDVQERSVLGKSVSRLRRSGSIPAVIYGHGAKPMPVQVTARNFLDALRRAGTTSMVSLNIPGRASPAQALIREVQHDPVTHNILHADFLQVNPAEEMEVELPVTLTGESPAERGGVGVLLHGATRIRVKGRADSLPSHFEADVSGLIELEQALHAGELNLPAGIELVTDPDEVVAVVTRTKVSAEEAAVEEAPEAVAPPAKEAASAEGTATTESKES